MNHGSDSPNTGDEDPMQRLDDELWECTSAEIDRLVEQRLQEAIQPVVPRDHVAAHQRLFADYFADEPRWRKSFFRRRFRMHRPLFMHIVSALEARYMYFWMRCDASGRPGYWPIQKCTAAIRQLAYEGVADMFDKYLHIGETTARECLKYFCRGVIHIFGPTYLRKPTPVDFQGLMNLHGRVHDFPGMLGSIDCIHWEWKNCSTAWKGMYTTGFKGKNLSVILEVVADYLQWIWHAYFGVARSNNDVNVLRSSPLFNEQCLGVGPTISLVANGNQHDMGYYLADEIYPRWPVFVKTIRCPMDPKKIYFAQRQEAARKDVERAFGVLQARWAPVKGECGMTISLLMSCMHVSSCIT